MSVVTPAFCLTTFPGQHFDCAVMFFPSEILQVLSGYVLESNSSDIYLKLQISMCMVNV